MACNESDEKYSLFSDKKKIRERLKKLDSRQYEIAMERKFLNHKLSDIEWNLNHPDEKVPY